MEKSSKLGVHYDPMTVPAPTGSDVFFYQDGMVPYLRLKVTSSSRTWVLDRSHGGKHVKRRLSRADLMGLVEARMQAYNWAKMLDQGELPPTVADRVAESFKALTKVEDIFKHYADGHLRLQARTCDNIVRGFELYWGPIRSVNLSSLKPAVVQQWLNEIASRSGKATANKQLTTLRAALRWASARGLAKMPSELFLAVKGFKMQESTSYLKQGDEVSRLTAALQGQSQDVRDAVWLLLWTGQRKGNVLAMEWGEIDWTSQLWIIPPSKTKTGKEYAVALTPKALEILERRKGCHGRYVFPACRASGAGHLRHINKAWLEVRAKANLGSLRLHDLRHTLGTWLAMGNANAFQIQKALQHANIRTSQKYIHLAADNVRDIMSAVQKDIV